MTILAIVSDLHANSTIGLCPPYVPLDDGGSYHASKAQRWLWNNWLDFWQTVKQRRGDKPLYIILNGDLVDGDHHHTPQLVSRNLMTQHEIALKCLEIPLALQPSGIFVLRGTEAHVGKSAQDEDAIAVDIGAIPDTETGRPSWWHLRAEFGGVLFDIRHHGKLGRLPWTQGNGANSLSGHLALQYARMGQPIPDVAIRSHLHQFAQSNPMQKPNVLACGAWQLATAYVHRAVQGVPLADIGGWIIECENGQHTAHAQRYKPEPAPIWRLK